MLRSLWSSAWQWSTRDPPFHCDSLGDLPSDVGSETLRKRGGKEKSTVHDGSFHDGSSRNHQIIIDLIRNHVSFKMFFPWIIQKSSIHSFKNPWHISHSKCHGAIQGPSMVHAAPRPRSSGPELSPDVQERDIDVSYIILPLTILADIGYVWLCDEAFNYLLTMVS